MVYKHILLSSPSLQVGRHQCSECLDDCSSLITFVITDVGKRTKGPLCHLSDEVQIGTVTHWCSLNQTCDRQKKTVQELENLGFILSSAANLLCDFGQIMSTFWP